MGAKRQVAVLLSALRAQYTYGWWEGDVRCLCWCLKARGTPWLGTWVHEPRCMEARAAVRGCGEAEAYQELKAHWNKGSV